jgi:hypothetical protein
MNGVMGIANAQRTLTYLRIFVEFVSQSEYRDVVGVYAPIISALHPKKAQTFFEQHGHRQRDTLGYYHAWGCPKFLSGRISGNKGFDVRSRSTFFSFRLLTDQPKRDRSRQWSVYSNTRWLSRGELLIRFLIIPVSVDVL